MGYIVSVTEGKDQVIFKRDGMKNLTTAITYYQQQKAKYTNNCTISESKNDSVLSIKITEGGYIPKYQWVLMADLGNGNKAFIKDIDGGIPGITDTKDEAMVFDERDNEKMKEQYYKALTNLKFKAVNFDDLKPVDSSSWKIN